jgi:hypothetical protein
VEAGLIVLVFLTLVLGMVDLAVGVFRNNALAEAAQMGARTAIVHGSLSVVETGVAYSGPWGPTNLSVAQNGVQAAINPFLSAAGIKGQAAITYLDGGNVPGNRVQVVVSTTYNPGLTFLFKKSFNLSAVSVMAITH